MTVPAGDRRSRLESSEEPDFSPWVVAPSVADTHIFWLPVSTFPIRSLEQAWLQLFLSRFAAALQGEGLREEVFLQFATATSEFSDVFQRYSQKAQVLPGLSRRPGEPLQGMPSVDQVKQEIEDNQAFDFSKWASDYTVWFQHKRGDQQRELFFGAGGMSLLYLTPDPRTVPPPLPFTPRLKAALPVFERIDVEAVLHGTMALNDRFLPHTKAVFGEGLSASIDPDIVSFVLPLFETRHLINATPEQRAAWFEVFDVYCRESPRDKGILLAFRKDFRTLLLAVLQGLEQDGHQYPLRSERAGH